jgi:hypothetical protein
VANDDAEFSHGIDEAMPSTDSVLTHRLKREV